MALSEDDRALLTLLTEGHDYERIAGVIGTDAEDVRHRAHDAAATLASDPTEPAFAERVRARLRELEGDAGPVGTWDLGSQARAQRARRLWLAMAAGAIALFALVVVITQLGGGSDGAETSAPDVQEDVVAVELAPVGGSAARGTAEIIRVEDRPAIELDIRGLAPTGAGQTYLVTLEDESGKALPIAFHPVGPRGRVVGTTPITTAASGLLPSLDFLVVSLADSQEAARAVRKAASTGVLPAHLGTTVLRGALPR